MFPDLKFALRSLLKTPGFTLAAILTLAIAIGTNTAVFSVFNRVVLRPLDFPDSGRLVRIVPNDPRMNFPTTLIDEYAVYDRYARSFAALCGILYKNFSLAGSEGAQPLLGLRVSGDFLKVLGVKLARGRNFTPAESAAPDGRLSPGAPVAILSHTLWRSRFGGRESLLGETIVLDGRAYTVIGILAPLPFPYADVQCLTPYDAKDASSSIITGRLRPDVTLEQATAEIARLDLRFAEEAHIPTTSITRKEVRFLSDEVIGTVRPTFYLLLFACALILLLACANVAALFLSRLASRQKEIALRLSLGATRRAIVRQFLTESLLFSVTAATTGLVISAWMVSTAARLIGEQMPRAAELSIDTTALLYSCALALVTGLLVGYLPALQASRPDLNGALKDGGRMGGTGNTGQRFRRCLVMAQVGICVALLVGASLLLESFWKLNHTQPGFSSAGVATAMLALPVERFDVQQNAQFRNALLDRLQTYPQIRGAAIGAMPLSWSYTRSYLPPGREKPTTSDQLFTLPKAVMLEVSNGYFGVLGIPLKAGRGFDTGDREGGQRVILINESFARRLFPGTSAIGKTLRTGDSDRVIVGVVGDTKSKSLALPAPDQIYSSLQQDPTIGDLPLLARTDGDSSALQSVLRSAVAAIDPNVTLVSFQTLDTVVARSLLTQRILAWLMGLFAAVAVLLAVVGLYSVLAYSVTQRTAEIGVRMALGAQRGHVLSMMVSQGMKLVVLGLLAGLGLAACATPLIRSMLYGIEPLDPLIFAGVAAFFAAIALVACLAPSLRASRIDPLVALRTE